MPVYVSQPRRVIRISLAPQIADYEMGALLLVTSLDTLQAQLKADMEARKARHPFPGGWRASSAPTRLEKDIVTFIGRLGSGYGKRFDADILVDSFDLPNRRNEDGPATAPNGFNRKLVVIDGGRALATRSWIVQNITARWKRSDISRFIRRKQFGGVVVRSNLYLYDVADLITVISESRTQHHLRPSVARLLQGSGSINEKLMNFIAASD